MSEIFYKLFNNYKYCKYNYGGDNYTSRESSLARVSNNIFQNDGR